MLINERTHNKQNAKRTKRMLLVQLSTIFINSWSRKQRCAGLVLVSLAVVLAARHVDDDESDHDKYASLHKERRTREQGQRGGVQVGEDDRADEVR